MSEEERYEELKDARLTVTRYAPDNAKLSAAEVMRLENAIRRDAREYVKKRYENHQGKQLYVAVTLHKIGAEVFKTDGPLQHKVESSLSVSAPSSTISISDLFKNINPTNGEFLKYVPDGFLSDRL